MVQIYYMFFTQLHITFCSVLSLYINIRINTKILIFIKKNNNYPIEPLEDVKNFSPIKFMSYVK